MAGAGSVVLVCRAPQVASGSIQREPRGEPRVVQLPRFRRLRSSATSSGTSRSLSLRDGTGSERRRPTRRDAAQESCRGRFPRSGQDASDATAQIHGLARFLSSSALQVMPCGAPVPACRADHGPPNETYRFFSCIYVWIAAKSATGGDSASSGGPRWLFGTNGRISRQAVQARVSPSARRMAARFLSPGYVNVLS